MFWRFWNTFIHRTLQVPYTLFVRTDIGRGKSVVLLHGIASSGATWVHVVKHLTKLHGRVLVLDLLGFGKSPKPSEEWVRYTVTDHARAVIRTLEAKHMRRPALLVGHSMGCFVAVEVATLRPDLVRELLLYEPPFYTGLPAGNRYRLRLAAYFSMYNAIIKRQPQIGTGRFKRAKKMLVKLYGFEITDETWIPFQRSMKNTILKQRALNDMKKLTLPIQIVYGKYDQVVINDKKRVFVGDAPNITAHEIPELHAVSPRASRVLAGLILQSFEKSA